MTRVKEALLAEVPQLRAPRRPEGTWFVRVILLLSLTGLALVLCLVALPSLGGDSAGDRAPQPAPEGMVRVRGGSVRMPADRSRPARWAVVGDFWMDRHDVKEEDFGRFVAATAYVPVGEGKPEAEPTECEPGRAEGHPSRRRAPLPREDAKAYAAWLGKRLPREVEAEWIRQQGLVARDQTPDGNAWIRSLGFRCVKSPR